jgi:hypothetical protein
VQIVRWDRESRARVIAAVLILGLSVYLVLTEPKGPSMWLVGFGGLIVGPWLLILAVVPTLRGTRGTLRGGLIVAAQSAVVLLLYAVVGRAVYSS